MLKAYSKSIATGAAAVLAAGVLVSSAAALPATDPVASTNSAVTSAQSGVPARVDGVGVRPGTAPTADTVDAGPAPVATGGESHTWQYVGIGASILLALALAGMLIRTGKPSMPRAMRPRFAGRDRG